MWKFWTTSCSVQSFLLALNSGITTDGLGPGDRMGCEGLNQGQQYARRVPAVLSLRNLIPYPKAIVLSAAVNNDVWMSF